MSISKKHQVVFNLLFSYTGLFISLFNTFFRVKVITPEEIGVIALITSITAIVSYFVLFGIPNILLRFLPKYNKREQTGIIISTLVVNITLFIIAGGVLYFFRTQIAGKYNNKLFSKYYNFIYLFLFSQVFFQYFDILLRTKYKSVFPSFIKDFLFRIMHSVLIIVIFFSKLEFEVYIYSYFILNFLTLLLLLIYYLINNNITSPSFNFIENKEYISFFLYSVYVLFAGLAGTIVTQIDKIMLGYYLTLGFTGIYTIAVSMGNIIGLIGGSFSKVTHPMISKNFADNDFKALERNYISVGEIQFAISSYMFLLLMIYGRQALLLLGYQYYSAYWVLILIGLSQVINLGTSTCGGIIVLSKYYKFDFISRLTLLFLNVIMNSILIPLYGINGAAIATALSLFLYNIMKVVFVYYKFKIVPFSVNYLRNIVVIFLTSLFLMSCKLISRDSVLFVLISIAISFILYYILLLVLKYNNIYFIDVKNRLKKML